MGFLLFLTIVCASFGSLGRITPFGDEVSIYLYEPFLVLSLFALLFAYRLKPFVRVNEKLRGFKLFLIYSFLNYLIFIVHYSVRENTIALLYLLRLNTYILFGLYFVHHVTHAPKRNTYIPLGIITSMVITIGTSFIQYYFYPDLRNLSYLEWDPHLYRMFGLFFDPFLSAAVYGSLILALFFTGEKLIKNQYLRWLCITFLISMFFLTYSRGAYLALLITIFAYLIRQKKYILIFVVLISFTLALFLLPKKIGEGMNLLRTSTIMTRLKDYETGIKIWRKNPILGIGYNRIRYEKIRLHEDGEVSILKSHAGASFHSSFLIILVTTGVFGFALFVYALLEAGKMSSMGLYSTIFLTVFSLTDNVLLHPVVLFFYFLFLGFSLNPSDT